MDECFCFGLIQIGEAPEFPLAAGVVRRLEIAILAGVAVENIYRDALAFDFDNFAHACQN